MDEKLFLVFSSPTLGWNGSQSSRKIQISSEEIRLLRTKIQNI
jgi:hypothetical protein